MSRMMLLDVNILVYAHREDAQEHKAYRQWLEQIINSNTAYAFSELVLSGFIRIVTHKKIFETPSPLKTAITFTEQIRSAQQAVSLAPGAKHWRLFVQCMTATSAEGNDIPDAYHAALAMEWNCEWVTTDKGFRRFKGLRVRHPLK